MTCPACDSDETITVLDDIAKCGCGARWELNPKEEDNHDT